MESFLSKLKELSSAEDFLRYFGVPFEQSVVNVSRLHILKRFFQYIRQANLLSSNNELDPTMHIVVCIKQVPDSAQIRVHPVTNTIMRQGVPAIVNPYDLFALEEALRLKDKFGGKVTMLCMGPPQAEDALRKCISFGADDAVLVTDRAFAGADTLATSYALAAAIRQIGSRAGGGHGLHRQADHRRRHRPGRPRHRQALGLQLLTYVSRIVETRPGGRTITVERRAEGGVQVLKTSCPA
jgi:electron transfer flavoprotein beta subunit